MSEPVTSSDSTPLPAVIVPPEDGQILCAFGDTALVKLTGAQSGNALSVLLDTTQPDCGPPPHRHNHEDELFLIVEGHVRFFANDTWTEPMSTGTLVYLPKGGVHAFQNVGGTPSKMWVIGSPGGFDKFFAACVPHFATEGAPPDMAAIVHTSGGHGIEYVPPLV